MICFFFLISEVDVVVLILCRGKTELGEILIHTQLEIGQLC